MSYLSRRSIMSGFIGTSLRLPRMSAATLDRDGMLQIEGKRTFIHGLYQTPKHTNGIRAAADAGFHVIHAPTQRDVLDTARTNGLRCWITVGSGPAGIRKIVGEFGNILRFCSGRQKTSLRISGRRVGLGFRQEDHCRLRVVEATRSGVAGVS